MRGVVVCTDKGLVIYRKNSESWDFGKVHFLGMPVGAFAIDKRTGAWWVAINHKHWGPKIHFSNDDGDTWLEMEPPKLPGESEKAVKSIWTIVPALNNLLYVGVEPAAIFVSEDYGDSYRMLSSLTEAGVSEKWMGGGKGSRSPFLHTVLVDPEDDNHLYAGISCAGIYQSYDAGESWHATNNGSKPFYKSKAEPISGYDPHCIRICSNPSIIWQQNHEGIYRSEDKGKSWQAASNPENDPHYGFAIVVDEDNDQEAWVVPAQSDDMRFPRDNALKVFHTLDGGKNWEAQVNGLPQSESFDLILRRGMAKMYDYLCFGTTNGNIYLSPDRGESWFCISQNLASIRDISFY